MANRTYNSTEDMIKILQQLKGKTKLKFYKNISNYYDNKKIRVEEDLFARNAQGINKTYHEVLLLKIVLQSKPQVRNMNVKKYDLYYTVIKNRNEEEIPDNQFESDYIKFSDITPNPYIGRKKAMKY